MTAGSASTLRSTAPPFSASRLLPASGSRTARTSACSGGVPPETWIVRSANVELSRAAKYAPVKRIGTAMTMASARRLAATRPRSPRVRLPLLDLEVPEQLDLVHQLDAVFLARPAAGLGDERERVLRARASG